MPYDLSQRLVIGLASSALFDLTESDQVFKNDGEEKYRQYQRDKEHEQLEQGVAFPFIKKLLSINEINPKNPPIEVILLSRNDPDTGLRVMNSIQKYELGITRALFLQGNLPYRYIPALNIDLFLSANEKDVHEAISQKYPAGYVLKSHFAENLLLDNELRIALDFDGVIIDDEAEKIFKSNNSVEEFHEYEKQHVHQVHNAGPLSSFLRKLSAVQNQEYDFKSKNSSYQPKLRISIVTARNAPSHERVIHTLREWGVTVNEAFFLCGVDKSKILEVLQPHIFFDDQVSHLDTTKHISPSVHIPFGIANVQ